MAAHRDYFSGWRDETFDCTCGWSGTSNGMSMELFAALAEYTCGGCDAHLILVSFPTGDDIKRAAAGGDEEARSMLEAVLRREREREEPRPPEVADAADLPPWLDEARTTPGFASFWDDGPAGTRAYVLACVALAGLDARSPADRTQLYAELITEPRATVVERLSAGEVPGEAVNTLERCDAAHFQLADWTALFAQLRDARTRRALSHVPHVTTTLVRQLAAIPPGLRRPSTLELLTTLAIDAEHWARITDALEQVGPDERQALIRGARNLGTAGDFFDLLYRCTDAALATSMARHGPIDLGPRFQPIVGADAMRAEGERMDNCLGRLVDRAMRGQSAYFAWRGEPRATVELSAVAGHWMLGEVNGQANEPVGPITEAAIRAAVVEAMGPDAVRDDHEAAGRVRGAAFEQWMTVGRRGFPDHDRADLAEVLWSLHGRALGPGDGAYVILAIPDGAYVQVLADRGSTYVVEISSHRYIPGVSDHLTSATVRLLEESGFEWPRDQANFQRILLVERHTDCVDLADFALGALRDMFGVREVSELSREVHVPRGDIALAATAHMKALLEK